MEQKLVSSLLKAELEEISMSKRCGSCKGRTRTNYPFGRSNKKDRNERRGYVKRNTGGISVKTPCKFCS